MFAPRLSAAFVAFALAVAPVAARAMTVQPVVIDMKTIGRDATATIQVQNAFTQPLPVELTVQGIDFADDGVKGNGKDTGDLLVFPPQALIQPGQTQAFRVQWVGDPQLAKSKHFYVTVAQLPVKLPEGQSAIQILYNFQVLVSVAAASGGPKLAVVKTEVVTAADKDGKAKPPQPALWVQNTGPSYGYLSRQRVRVIEKDGSGKEVFRKTLSPQEIQQTVGFGLVGPEATRKLVLPLDLPTAAGTLQVELADAGAQ